MSNRSPRSLRRVFLVPLLLSALSLPALLGAARADEEPAVAPRKPVAVTGRFEEVDGQRVLYLWGTARERGFAQGYLLAERILAGVSNDFERIMKPLLPRYERLVKTLVIPQFKFNERELAEMQGLFDGIVAKLPKEKLRLESLQRDVELVDIKALNTFGDWYGLGCSSLAVWGKLSADGLPLVGRNFDFPAFDLVLQHQYVVVRAPDGDAQGQVGVSYPGCVGIVTGMNADGAFVAIHDVPIRPKMETALRPNVPRLMAVRRILEQVKGAGACGKAHALLDSWPTLYGNNLMVVASQCEPGVPCAAVLEYDCRLEMDGGCSVRLDDGVVGDGVAETGDGGDGAAAKEARAPALCLTCTNHHRLRARPEGYLELRPRWRYPVLSCVGEDATPEKPLTVDDMFVWMGKASYPRGDQVQERAEGLLGKQARHGTLHQVVGEPGSKRLHVRLGVVGKHIRTVSQRTYDVSALLKPLSR